MWTAIGLITGRQDSTPERQGRMMSWLQRRLAAGHDHGNRLVVRRLVTPTRLLAVAIGLADARS